MYPKRGMSLIDVIVGTALFLIIFLGLATLLRTSAVVSSLVKSETAATAIANNQMEYIRSLSYGSVGTVGGIPSGVVIQDATTTQDAITYNVHTFIEYYDDPTDGTGLNDTNHITADYKKIAITITYVAAAKPRSYQLVSNYAPPGLETTAGGGTLQINVVNAGGNPVAGATIHITNASTSPTVDLTAFSDTDGTLFLPGAATSTQYAVTVTKNGYSSATTYVRDGNNQNPTPGYLTIAGNQTTTGTFAIDVLGTLTLSSFLPGSTSSFTDAFSDASKIGSQSGTVVSSGMLMLAGGSGSYVTDGTAISTSTTPTYLASWGVASSTVSVPAGTTLVLQVVDGSGQLLPDTVLPGNSLGFATSTLNLSGVSTSTYPTLALKATLHSGSVTATPVVDTWSLTYQTGPKPLPNVAFTLTGSKTIGSTGGGAPIYKTVTNSTTGASASVTSTLEWDAYALGVTGYDVIDACDSPPYELSPGDTDVQRITLGSSTPNSMLVTVTDSGGTILPGTSVKLSRSGYTKTAIATSCGNAYFGALTAATDYSISISKPGYTTATMTPVSVSGHGYYAASF